MNISIKRFAKLEHFQNMTWGKIHFVHALAATSRAFLSLFFLRSIPFGGIFPLTLILLLAIGTLFRSRLAIMINCVFIIAFNLIMTYQNWDIFFSVIPVSVALLWGPLLLSVITLVAVRKKKK